MKLSLSLTPVFQCMLGCSLLFIAGASFALGTFTVPVERSAPDGNLDGIWEISLGFVHFVSAVVSVATSIFLSSVPPHKRFRRMRALLVLSAAGTMSLTAASRAVATQSRALIIPAVSIYALPLAISKSALSLSCIPSIPQPQNQFSNFTSSAQTSSRLTARPHRARAIHHRLHRVRGTLPPMGSTLPGTSLRTWTTGLGCQFCDLYTNIFHVSSKVRSLSCVNHVRYILNSPVASVYFFFTLP